MVTSNAATVDEFFANLPEDRVKALTRLRELCKKALGGFEECMDLGMPSYKRGDVVEVAFNSQKNHISVYVCRQDIMDKHQILLGSLDCGKGCIRFKKPEHLDYKILHKLFNAVKQAKPQAGRQ